MIDAAASPAFAAEPWEPFPPTFTYNDFGGVGLLQTPTARFAPDAEMTFAANRVWPYERYSLTIQATPWLEGTLRLSTVKNRLYSGVPAFSGDQSYKDRGFDIKIRVIEEGDTRPEIALGLRDFIGTGLFSSEYLVVNKSAGPVDLSLGIGWGNLGARGLLPNPFRLISSRFDDRGVVTQGGGDFNSAYFKGRQVGLFGGIKYDTPIKNLILKVEYDPNDYQHEALFNRFNAPLPVNVGVDYAVRSWLRVGASFERGNRLGLNLALTNNFNHKFRIPKFDPPPTPVEDLTPKQAPAAVAARPSTETSSAEAATARLIPEGDAPTAVTPPASPVPATSFAAEPQAAESDNKTVREKLVNALAYQGSGLYAANFRDSEVTLYVGQSRFQNMATGLGRISRAAFAVLPERYRAVDVVFVESGMETISVRVYRDALIKTLTPGAGSPEEMLSKTDFATAPLEIGKANFQAPLSEDPPHFFYSVRPLLKTTLGRPEQFILYEAGVRVNGFLEVRRGLNVQGAVTFDLSDNFDKLKINSDSVLPHVRSDIKDYLREGKTALAQLHANYTFNVAPDLYGHVFGGLLEEMYGGVGGEILYRRPTQNWAVGADLTFVKQRAFDQRFSFRDYQTVTGFVTAAYYLPRANLDFRIKAGRYLAKDYGATFEVARTFDSGVVVGAFATKTNVSAAEFGEGRFDKGFYISIPLDALYVRHVRGSIGLAYRPLIRDGGQMLQLPQPLLVTTDDTIAAKFRRDWNGIIE